MKCVYKNKNVVLNKGQQQQRWKYNNGICDNSVCKSIPHGLKKEFASSVE